MKNILLLGSGGTAGYNFTQSLKAQGGYRVVGMDTHPYHAFASGADFPYLTPKNEEEKLDLIYRLDSLFKFDFIHAQPDAEVQFLDRNRESFKNKISLPSSEALKVCADKLLTHIELASFGIKTPVTNTLRMYLYSKPKGKYWVRCKTGAGSKASLPVTDPNQALHWANYWKDKENLSIDDFIVSEFLPGEEYAWQSVWKNGRLMASQGRVRLEYLFGNLTPSGQTSTPSVARTVHNEILNTLCMKTIRAVDPNPNGVYGVDCKTDADGQIKVTEINAGRFYSTSLFYQQAGCNMPHHYIEGSCAPTILNSAEGDCYWIRAVDRPPFFCTQKQFDLFTENNV